MTAEQEKPQEENIWTDEEKAWVGIGLGFGAILGHAFLGAAVLA
jgi:hypothetical protein